MNCNHCGSTDISTKVWFCWSCCKQIQTPEQITEEQDQENIELLEEQPQIKEKKGKKK